jgi:hypothetical protein
LTSQLCFLRHNQYGKKEKLCLNKNLLENWKEGGKYHASGITSWQSSGKKS